MPRDPITGEKIELGRNGPKGMYDKLQEKVHAYMHPEEVAMNAREKLRKMQEEREEAIKRAEENAKKYALRIRSKPLVRAGPEPYGPPARKSFLMEMYKPPMGERVYQTNKQ